jgi:hypothetical protein
MERCFPAGEGALLAAAGTDDFLEHGLLDVMARGVEGERAGDVVGVDEARVEEAPASLRRRLPVDVLARQPQAVALGFTVHHREHVTARAAPVGEVLGHGDVAEVGVGGHGRPP